MIHEKKKTGRSGKDIFRKDFRYEIRIEKEYDRFLKTILNKQKPIVVKNIALAITNPLYE